MGVHAWWSDSTVLAFQSSGESERESERDRGRKRKRAIRRERQTQTKRNRWTVRKTGREGEMMNFLIKLLTFSFLNNIDQ